MERQRYYVEKANLRIKKGQCHSKCSYKVLSQCKPVIDDQEHGN